MTNSEAVSLLMNSQYYKQGYKQGVSDTLDKISVEIEKETDRDNHADDYCDGMRNALAIIDKYKSELNPQESEDKG